MGDVCVKYYDVGGIVIKREFRDRIHDYCFDSGRWDEILYWKSDPNDPASVPVSVEEISDSDWDNEISENMAMEIITDQTLAFLKEKWKSDFAEKKAEWDKCPGWPAKLVETWFELNGIEKVIKMKDLPKTLTGGPWSATSYIDVFFESIQGDIEKDLEAFGAKKIYSFGFMD